MVSDLMIQDLDDICDHVNFELLAWIMKYMSNN